jgi:hypothetical protein
MPTAPATTVVRTTTTTQPFLGPGSTRGALPDGTLFDVHLDPSRIESLTGSSAGIIVELDARTSPVAGVLVTSRGPIEASGWDGSTYQIRTGSSSVELEAYDDVVDALGPDYKEIFEKGIVGSEVAGYPVLELTPPFRWATDDEIPLQMEVAFDTFVVRRGCGELAVACSPTHLVQVIPAASVFAPAPAWAIGQQVWIESPGPRPISDPWFLDPGPLGPRATHDVIWTEEEMIVWGGASGDRPPHLVEGAAFDPETNEWRMLPPAPIEQDQETRAIWADEAMIVMSPEETLSYRPSLDEWHVVGEGFRPAVYPGMTVLAGGRIYTWAPKGIVELHPSTGVWRELPRPGLGGFDPYLGALRSIDGILYAIGSADAICEGRLISEWTGAQGLAHPVVSLATPEYADCSYPNQTAVIDGRLVVWGDETLATKALDPGDGAWVEVGTTTLSSTEGPSGPVILEGGVVVPQYDEASIYDPVAERWTEITLPGYGNDTDMVWTGDEVLMWGAACCFGDGSNDLTSQDAWRWTPPEN